MTIVISTAEMGLLWHLFVGAMWLAVAWLVFVLVFGGICLLFAKDEPPKPRVPAPKLTHEEVMRELCDKEKMW